MKVSLKSFIIILFILLSFLSVLAKDLSLAPDFKLEDITGKKVTLSSFKDKKPVILFFWTTWCPSCVKGLRLLNDMHADFLGDDVELLFINIGESRSKIERFLKNKYPPYSVLLDKDTEIAYLFDVLGVPTYVIINKAGGIVYKDNYFPYEEYKDLVNAKEK
ncbi:MAG: TlpA disulfide reductase family protein [Candidatus Omnitrophota bacterium]|nr:TlpA disulfide reductase family protein [Candidatus Omnitrophota bacterium]